MKLCLSNCLYKVALLALLLSFCNCIYVSSVIGNDLNDGESRSTPVATLSRAFELALLNSKQAGIILMAGHYTGALNNNIEISNVINSTLSIHIEGAGPNVSFIHQNSMNSSIMSFHNLSIYSLSLSNLTILANNTHITSSPIDTDTRSASIQIRNVTASSHIILKNVKMASSDYLTGSQASSTTIKYACRGLSIIDTLVNKCSSLQCSNYHFVTNYSSGVSSSTNTDTNSFAVVLDGIYIEARTTLDNGAALYTKGTNMYIINSQFTWNEIETSSTDDAAGGGAISINGNENTDDTSVLIVNTILSSNHAPTSICGAFKLARLYSILLDNVELRENTALAGGAICASDTFDRFIVLNSYFSGNRASGPTYGGGAVLVGATDLIIDTSSFVDNIAAVRGGAVSNEPNAASVRVLNCLFHANSVSAGIVADGRGGALYMAEASAGQGGVTITGSNFTECSAIRGGGSYSYIVADGTILTNNTYTGNSAQGGGGHYSHTTDTHVEGCSFSHNSGMAWSSNSGGGAALMLYQTSESAIFDTYFGYNSAKVWGGAVKASSASASFTRCTFTANTVDDSSHTLDKGGGVFGEYADYLHFDSCTFSNNFAGHRGGGYYLDTIEFSVTSNCTFSDNKSGGGSGSYHRDVRIAHLHSSKWYNGICTSDSVGGGHYAYNYVLRSNANLTVINSTFANNIGVLRGGGLGALYGGFLVLQESSFYDNSVTGAETDYYGGGGAFASSWQNAHVSDCVFYRNTAGPQGGGLSLRYIWEDATIIDSSFINNTCTASGGGFWCYRCYQNILLLRTTFQNDVSLGWYGGAVAALNEELAGLTTQMEIESCKFISNQAGKLGGGVEAWAVSTTISNSLFQSNSAFIDPSISNSVEEGGAFHCYYTDSVTLEHNYFIENVAGYRGGSFSLDRISNIEIVSTTVVGSRALHEYGGGFSIKDATTMHIENATFIRNNASRGGAVYMLDSSDVTFSNSVFRSNTADDRGGAIAADSSNLEIENSFFESNSLAATASKGGAISVESCDSFIINGSYLSSGSAGFGGALFIDLVSSVAMTSTGFVNNTAGSDGGAVLATQASLALNSVVFDGNTAAAEGGALFLEQADTMIKKSELINSQAMFGGAVYTKQATLELELLDLSGNQAHDGGAIFATSDLVLQDCHFNQNTVTRSGGHVHTETAAIVVDQCDFVRGASISGAGITALSATHVNITNSKFLLNEATAFGGAVTLGDTTGSGRVFSLDRNTFFNNSAGEGGAIFLGDVVVSVRHAHFKHNRATSQAAVVKFSTSSSGAKFSITDSLIELSIGDDHAMQIYDVIFSAANTVWQDNTGGGLELEASVIDLHNLTFSGNTAVEGAGLVIDECTATRIEKLTFDDNVAEKKAGALLVEKGGPFVIIDTVFMNNQATATVKDSQAGSILVEKVDDIIFRKFHIEGSRASVGGAMILEKSDTILEDGLVTATTAADKGAIRVDEGNVTIYDIVFEGNTVTEGDAGALIIEKGSAYIFSSSFVNNTAITGGAIAADQSQFVYIDNCHFESSSAESGGAVYIDRAVARLYGNLFVKNSATHGDGGAITLVGSHTRGSSNQFVGNAASCRPADLNNCKPAKGGAIAVSGDASSTTGTEVKELWLSESIFTDNFASQSGALFIKESLSVDLVNVQFSGNTANEIDSVGRIIADAWINLDNVHVFNNSLLSYKGTDTGSTGLSLSAQTMQINVTNCVFIDNKFQVDVDDVDDADDADDDKQDHIEGATFGGALGVLELFDTDDETTVEGRAGYITNCVFSNNRAGRGGGLYVQHSLLMLSNLTVTHNQANRGAGIYLTYCPDFTTNYYYQEQVVASLQIENNTALRLGGAVFFETPDCEWPALSIDIFNQLSVNNQANVFGPGVASSNKIIEFHPDSATEIPSIADDTQFIIWFKDDFENHVIDETTLRTFKLIATVSFVDDDQPETYSTDLGGQPLQVLGEDGVAVFDTFIEATLNEPIRLKIEAFGDGVEIGSLNVTGLLTECSLGESYSVTEASCQKCTRGTYRLSYEHDECIPCPTGSVCQENVVLAETDYWRDPAIDDADLWKADAFYLCNSGRCCPDGGVIEEITGLQGCASEAACADRRDGIMCGGCVDGYYSNGDGCVECDGTDAWMVFALFIFMAAFIMFALVTYPSDSMFMPVCLFFFQSIPFVVHDTWAVADAFQFFNLNFVGLTSSSSCLGRLDKFQTLQVELYIALLWWGAFMTLWLLIVKLDLCRTSCTNDSNSGDSTDPDENEHNNANLCCKIKKSDSWLAIIFSHRTKESVFENGFYTMLKTSYMQITAVSLELTVCRSVSDTAVLVSSTTDECWTAEHIPWAIISFLLLALVTFGLPIWLVWKHRAHDNLPFVSFDEEEEARLRRSKHNHARLAVSGQRNERALSAMEYSESFADDENYNAVSSISRSQRSQDFPDSPLASPPSPPVPPHPFSDTLNGTHNGIDNDSKNKLLVLPTASDLNNAGHNNSPRPDRSHNHRSIKLHQHRHRHNHSGHRNLIRRPSALRKMITFNYSIELDEEGELQGRGLVPWLKIAAVRHKEYVLLMFYRSSITVALSVSILDYVVVHVILGLWFLLLAIITIVSHSFFKRHDVILDVVLLQGLACISALEGMIGMVGVGSDDPQVTDLRQVQATIIIFCTLCAFGVGVHIARTVWCSSRSGRISHRDSERTHVNSSSHRSNRTFRSNHNALKMTATGIAGNRSKKIGNETRILPRQATLEGTVETHRRNLRRSITQPSSYPSPHALAIVKRSVEKCSNTSHFKVNGADVTIDQKKTSKHDADVILRDTLEDVDEEDNCSAVIDCKENVQNALANAVDAEEETTHLHHESHNFDVRSSKFRSIQIDTEEIRPGRESVTERNANKSRRSSSLITTRLPPISSSSSGAVNLTALSYLPTLQRKTTAQAIIGAQHHYFHEEAGSHIKTDGGNPTRPLRPLRSRTKLKHSA